MDIKQITLNGVTYNLKDQAARTALAACVNAGNYNSTDKLLEFKNGNTLLFSIDATAFIKDGMVDSVVVEDGNLVITFNTESGKEPISIPLTDIFNPDLYYTKSEIDAAMQKKANTDGWYPRMVVGAAESVIGKDISVDESTDYVVQGGTGIAKVNEVMGRSEKWNQLAKFKLEPRTVNDVTYSLQTNGKVKVSGTASAAVTTLHIQEFPCVGITNHKYLLKTPKTADDNFYIYWYGIGIYSSSGTGIYTCTNPADAGNITIRCKANAVINYEDYIAAIDLTNIYGEGNEPTTVEQFEADVFAKYGKTLDEYFEYDAGSINNANVEKLDITGFNQWDEEWEAGGYDATTGEKKIQSTTIRNKNYIPILPSADYSCNASNYGGSYCVMAFVYDANKNYLARIPISQNTPFTTPQNAAYLNFYVRSEYGLTYNHDICINISDPTKNGTYEPYKHVELPTNIKTATGKVNGEGESVTIFPNGMHGVGTAYDSLIVDEDGWARRAIVRMADRAYQEGDESNTSVLTDGTTTIYALATPIEYVLDNPILMTFNAYNGGVIRQIKGDMELATRINITFALNVQGFINNANKAFISAASMQAFLTKLSSAKGGTWGMTYNATTQQYEFTYNQ